LGLKGKNLFYVENNSKGDDPMNKVGLLKNLLNSSRGNLFSTEIKQHNQAIEEVLRF
jgi:hypothetical protein